MKSNYLVESPVRSDACWRRSAHTLLELVAASSLLALTIVPALRMIRDSLEQNQRVERLEVLNMLCISTLEQQLCLTAANWTEATSNGTFASEGYSTLRYTAVRSQQPAAGGIAGQLMAVSVTVWDDTNGNAALDANEPRVVQATKMASLAAYQSEASGS
jgi:hypothetical protein